MRTNSEFAHYRRIYALQLSKLFYPKSQLRGKDLRCMSSLRTGYALTQENAHWFRTRHPHLISWPSENIYALVLRTGTSAKLSRVVGKHIMRTGYALVLVRV